MINTISLLHVADAPAVLPDRNTATPTEVFFQEFEQMIEKLQFETEIMDLEPFSDNESLSKSFENPSFFRLESKDENGAEVLQYQKAGGTKY